MIIILKSVTISSFHILTEHLTYYKSEMNIIQFLHRVFSQNPDLCAF